MIDTRLIPVSDRYQTRLIYRDRDLDERLRPKQKETPDQNQKKRLRLRPRSFFGTSCRRKWRMGLERGRFTGHRPRRAEALMLYLAFLSSITLVVLATIGALP